MPRANLDAEVVTQAAAAIVEVEGLAALTLARVATDLGVASPSLYKHVAGLADLTGRVTTLAIRRMSDALAAVDTGHGARCGLVALADAYRRFAIQHAELYALTQNATECASDNQRIEIARALKIFGTIAARYGLRDATSINAIRMVRAALHGFVDIERRGGFQMHQDIDESFFMLVDMLDAALSGLAAKTRNPSASREECSVDAGRT